MSPESRFGDNRSSDHHQLMKGALHKVIIDALEEQDENLLEAGRKQLRLFVDARVSEYARSRQLPISRYEQDQLSEELVDELTGFGPLETLLKDTDVTEILVNGPGRIFIERRGVLHRCELRFIDNAHLIRVIQRILAPVGRRLDESSPMVDARMPDGSRINAVIPPVAIDGPALSIRKFRQDMLKSTDLLAAGSLDENILVFLDNAVASRCNILVSGGTGTGKTTMLNLLSQHISAAERIVTIEDTAELQLKHDHVVRLETRPPNTDGYGEIAARDLVRNALRMRPDRILLGEIRGVEVLDVLTAMNTGHDGSMTTIHANNAQDALLRLESLVGMSGIQVAERTLKQTVCSAIDLVIQLVRLSDGRRCVSEVLEVISLREEQYVTNTLFRLQTNGGYRFVKETGRPGGEKIQHLKLGK